MFTKKSKTALHLIFMRKFLLLLSCLFTIACSSNNENISNIPTITIEGSDELYIGDDALEYSISFEASTTWNAFISEPQNPDWISLLTRGGNAGKSTLIIELQPNSEVVDREAKITINAGSTSSVITIIQKRKGALILTSAFQEVNPYGETLQVELMANLEYDVIIPTHCAHWIILTETRSLSNYIHLFEINPNDEIAGSREGEIIFKDKVSLLADTMRLTQGLMINERNILIELYHALDGDNWSNNNNWLSDKPLNEWYGIEMKNRQVTAISLPNNNVGGYIPEVILDLTALKTLNFYANNISGTIPERIGELVNLTHLGLSYNKLSGSIPESIGNLTKLDGLGLSGNELSGPIPEGLGNLPGISYMFLDQNQLTGNIPTSFTKLFDIVQSPNNLNLTWNHLSGVLPNEIVNHSRWRELSAKFLQQHDGYILTFAHYESTDYSRDGEIVKWQNASSGNGINIVVMGDGFVDQDIANGTYEKVMKKTMENFFAIEPVRSFRDHFNFYSVTAVSKNNFFGEGFETALDVYFGGEMFIGGYDDKCFEYAERITGFDPEKSVIMVVANATQSAGTTSIYNNGETIAYFPMCFGLEHQYFADVIHHEAIGHALTKLADEYYTNGPKETHTIPAQSIEYIKTNFHSKGWYMNIDFTNNPNEILWNKFLKDERYKNEGLGIFEGGLTWPYGVYRPSENSTMHSDHFGAFNAPSREAIYKRIMSLAYGSGWIYDYEEFATYDIINRNRPIAKSLSVEQTNRPQNHAPVFKGVRK